MGGFLVFEFSFGWLFVNCSSSVLTFLCVAYVLDFLTDLKGDVDMIHPLGKTGHYLF